MLKKTLERIERRFSSLPLHHIDTSIILEPEKTTDGRFCRQYIQKLGYNYRGVFSSPVLGELMLSVFLMKDETKKHAFLDFLSDTVNARNIEFYTPKNIHPIAMRISEIDSRLEPLDVDIVACAIENKAVNLITLDKDLIENKAIEEEFGLKIFHPKSLL